MSESKDQAGEPVDRDDVEQAPEQGETSQAVPQTRAEYRAVTGEQPVVDDQSAAASAADEPAPEAPADEPTVAFAAPADEPAADAPAVDEPVADASAPEPAVNDVTPEPGPERAPGDRADEPASGDAEEPDYEALAAELDRLEADTAAASPVAPGAPDPQPSGAKHPWFEPAKTETFRATEPVAEPEPEPEPVVTPSEPAPPAAAPAPIFVQAPEPPKKRGNRGAAGLIGLPAALSFAVLYLAASAGIWWFYELIGRGTGQGDIVAILIDTAQSPAYWGTVIAFWLSFWLLGAFVNRARWWSWVVLGVFVALLTYVGHLASLLLAEPFWMITRAEGVDLLIANVLSPIALAALILAREVTIWFGAWVSKRGARIARENAAAQEEHENALASGPQAG